MKYGSYGVAFNKLCVMQYRKMDANFVHVRYLLQDKGKCSHEEVIHIKFITALAGSFDWKSCSNMKEFRVKYPEEFL